MDSVFVLFLWLVKCLHVNKTHFCPLQLLLVLQSPRFWDIISLQSNVLLQGDKNLFQWVWIGCCFPSTAFVRKSQVIFATVPIIKFHDAIRWVWVPGPKLATFWGLEIIHYNLHTQMGFLSCNLCMTLMTSCFVSCTTMECSSLEFPFSFLGI